MLFIIYLIMYKVYFMVCASAWAMIQMVKRVDYLPSQMNTPYYILHLFNAVSDAESAQHIIVNNKLSQCMRFPTI